MAPLFLSYPKLPVVTTGALNTLEGFTVSHIANTVTCAKNQRINYLTDSGGGVERYQMKLDLLKGG